MFVDVSGDGGTSMSLTASPDNFGPNGGTSTLTATTTCTTRAVSDVSTGHAQDTRRAPFSAETEPASIAGLSPDAASG